MRKHTAGFLTIGILGVCALYAALVFFARTPILVDGKKISHYSFKKDSVQNILNLYEITYSSDDMISPPVSESPRWGQKIKVVRVTRSVREEAETVDFVLDWKRRTSKNLRLVEIQNGYRERKTWTVVRTFLDGTLDSEKRSETKTQKFAVRRLALLTSRGKAEKVYDLSQSQKMRLIATAYWKGDPQVPGEYTFLDHYVQRGLVAVDPKVIPLRSRLYIPGYGYAYASDTGSAIKGKRIDLFVESKQASRRWEHVPVDVYILEKAQKW